MRHLTSVAFPRHYTSGFLNLGMVNILGWTNLCHCRTFSSTPGVPPLEASSTPRLAQPPRSPDWAKCAPGGKVTLRESHWYKLKVYHLRWSFLLFLLIIYINTRTLFFYFRLKRVPRVKGSFAFVALYAQKRGARSGSSHLQLQVTGFGGPLPRVSRRAGGQAACLWSPGGSAVLGLPSSAKGPACHLLLFP